MKLDEIKGYLRVDGDADDKLLKALKLEAEEYLQGAGITKDYQKSRYKLAILLLVADSYENRQVRGDSKLATVTDRLSRLILQLQMEEGV